MCSVAVFYLVGLVGKEANSEPQDTLEYLPLDLAVAAFPQLLPELRLNKRQNF